LALARLNANALGVNIRLVQSDWLAAVEDNSVDLVVSNPPYISEQECDGLDRTVRDFEPRLALSGGGTGMEAISRLVQEASRVLISGGWLLMEIGDDQAEAVTELLCPTHPTIQLNNLKFDYAGRARIVMARRRSR
jgi:release factor glutamine methyltransferase